MRSLALTVFLAFGCTGAQPGLPQAGDRCEAGLVFCTHVNKVPTLFVCELATGFDTPPDTTAWKARACSNNCTVTSSGLIFDCN